MASSSDIENYDEINTTISPNYEDWSPMSDVYHDFLTVNFNRHGDPLGITGYQNLPKEQTPCKFYNYNSVLKTCSRPGCQYLHAPTKFVEPVVKEEIILANEIELKTRAEAGLINVGIVVAITDPWDFCIIPHSNWICGCKLNYIGEERHKRYGWGTSDDVEITTAGGVANLFRLFEDFRQFDRTRQLVTDLCSLTTNQVVAVSLPSIDTQKGKEWYRAVVLEDTVLGEGNKVNLSLMDYGTQIEADFSQIALLPRKLLRYPPLGCRCALNGTSPISHQWSPNAVKLFADLVHGKECVFELIKPSFPENGIFETEPNLVELSIRIDGKFVNLSEKLIYNGMCVRTNPFPTETALLDGIEDFRAVGIFLSQRITCGHKTSKDLLNAISQKERPHMRNHLLRMMLDSESSTVQSMCLTQQLPISSPLAHEPNHVLNLQFVRSYRTIDNCAKQAVESCDVGNSSKTSLRVPNSKLEYKQERKTKTKWKPLQL